MRLQKAAQVSGFELIGQVEVHYRRHADQKIALLNHSPSRCFYVVRSVLIPTPRTRCFHRPFRERPRRLLVVTMSRDNSLIKLTRSHLMPKRCQGGRGLRNYVSFELCINHLQGLSQLCR